MAPRSVGPDRFRLVPCILVCVPQEVDAKMELNIQELYWWGKCLYERREMEDASPIPSE